MQNNKEKLAHARLAIQEENTFVPQLIRAVSLSYLESNSKKEEKVFNLFDRKRQSKQLADLNNHTPIFETPSLQLE